MSNTGQIIKSRSTERFTVIPNEISQSTTLTIEEKGFLTYLLSLPQNWVLYRNQLYDILPDSRGTIDRVFQQLQHKGYIISVKSIDDKGRFNGWNHVIYDEPNISTDNLENRSRSKPRSVFSEIGQSAPIIKTNKIKKTNKGETHEDSIVLPDNFSETTKGYVKVYNEIFGKNFKYKPSLDKPLALWMQTYTSIEIKRALINAKENTSNWLHEMVQDGPEKLLRTKNKSGSCDYIGELLNAEVKKAPVPIAQHNAITN